MGKKNNNMTIPAGNTHYIHSFQEDALGQSDAVALASLLRKGHVSAQELAQAARKRALLVSPEINAIAFNRPTHSLPKADKSDALFYGIPSFIKDNLAIKNLPTNFGSAAFKAKPEKRHGFYAQQILSTGINVLGKSTLPEFGLNASTEPAHMAPTKNPWHLDFSSGASSGGSAALVASGVVPFAHGNDGGGSIRIPAACCGLVGLKPSRNRHINEAAARSLPINIVSEGILSRTVRDTAYFHVEMQKHYRYTNLPVLPLVTHANKQRLKIGLLTDSITGYSTDSETRQAVLNTAQQLKQAGHYVEEMKFPVSAQFTEDFTLYWGMLSALVKNTGKVMFGRQFNAQKLDNLSLGLAKHYRKSMHKTPLFLYRLRQHAQQFQRPFERYDAYLSPVLAKTTVPLGELDPESDFEVLLDRLTRYASFTPMANIAGTPAISLPAGLTENGLPIGIQLSAALGQEQTLLELAYELEEIQPWAQLYHQK
jgi:amidase